eukprot:3940915-Rhodomonas_salina.1
MEECLHRDIVRDVILSVNRGPDVQLCHVPRAPGSSVDSGDSQCASPIQTQQCEWEGLDEAEMAEMANIANQDDIVQDAFEQGDHSVTRVYSDLTPISLQDIVPLPLTQSPPLFDHSTAEWLGTPLDIDASQPAGFEGDEYISHAAEDTYTLGNPYNSQQTDTDPIMHIDGQDTISVVLEDPVEQRGAMF